MKYLKSINETITIDQIDQTIKWIKERVGYSDLVEIFEEIKQNFDDVGDFKWYSELPNVIIEYSYLVGKRNMKKSFRLLSKSENTDGVRDYINTFLKRMESVTKISVNIEMSFSSHDWNIPVGTYQKVLEDAFINLRTIESIEGIEIKISCPSHFWQFGNVSSSEFQHFLKDPKSQFINPHNTIKIFSTKELPNNIFSGDDGTDPIEKLPQSIIKDFTEFVNKVKLTKADRKELIDIIERGYRKSE